VDIIVINHEILHDELAHEHVQKVMLHVIDDEVDEFHTIMLTENENNEYL
jgi:hypothetical protein